MKRAFTFTLAVALLLSLTACGTTQAEQPAEPNPTQAVTSTPEPEQTPEPTATPEPVADPEPAQTQTQTQASSGTEDYGLAAMLQYAAEHQGSGTDLENRPGTTQIAPGLYSNPDFAVDMN